MRIIAKPWIHKASLKAFVSRVYSNLFFCVRFDSAKFHSLNARLFWAKTNANFSTFKLSTQIQGKEVESKKISCANLSVIWNSNVPVTLECWRRRHVEFLNFLYIRSLKVRKKRIKFLKQKKKRTKIFGSDKYVKWLENVMLEIRG